MTRTELLCEKANQNSALAIACCWSFSVICQRGNRPKPLPTSDRLRGIESC